MKGKGLPIVLVLALFLLAGSSVKLAEAHGGGGDNVGICHSTNSPTNPFVYIEPAKSADVSGHDKDGQDIIPPFGYVAGYEHRHGWWFFGCHYSGPWSPGKAHGGGCVEERTILGTYPGKNMSTLYQGFTGAEVLANGCVIPTPPYVPCSVTVAQPPITSPTTWGPWLQLDEDTYTRTGSFTVTTTYLDSENVQLVCDIQVVTFPAEETKDGRYESFPTNNCEGWTETILYYNPDGVEGGRDFDSALWANPYEIETATSSFGTQFAEPEECLYYQDYKVNKTNDCTGWRIEVVPASGGTVKYDGPTAGTWLRDNKMESASVSGTITWLDQSTSKFSIAISEGPECYFCEMVPIYRMVALVDYDAPDWYWGKEERNGSCWIIMHEDGTFPNPDRQANVCSVCSHPDFVYQADKIVADGYVYFDCNGTVIYEDQEWDPKWYRQDYNCINHKASCLTK